MLLTTLVILAVLFASGCAQKGGNETGGGNVSKNATNQSNVYKSDKNLMQILSDDEYVTLVKLINASGLNDTLAKGGPYTVFAPTDKAFEALPTGSFDTLMNNTIELRRILSYHVTSGEVTEQDLANMTGIQMLEGEILPVNNTTEGLYVGGAKITDTDTRPSNGIIHQIDKVLVPPK
jgi:uncharacterized surface protein with fasciclin (FAS1) repeats